MKNWRVIKICVLAAVVMFMMGAEMRADVRYGYVKQPLIVIDPGHGGRDGGVKGPTGVLEKTVVIVLARSLAQRLEADYRVQLTRTDDYDLALLERTALVNQLQAALYISLHCGGSFLHQAKGVTLFYFDRGDRTHSISEPNVDEELSKKSGPTPWDEIQTRHQTDSKILAFTLQQHLESVPLSASVRVREAPLAVLMGANAPAVLMEVGYLSNPEEEKRLSDPEYLSKMAAGIEKAIKAYFSKKVWLPSR